MIPRITPNNGKNMYTRLNNDWVKFTSDQWLRAGCPDVGGIFPDPGHPFGERVIIDIQKQSDYEANLNGVDKVSTVFLNLFR